MLKVLPYVIVILATFFCLKGFDTANRIDLQAIANTDLKPDKNTDESNTSNEQNKEINPSNNVDNQQIITTQSNNIPLQTANEKNPTSIIKTQTNLADMQPNNQQITQTRQDTNNNTATTPNNSNSLNTTGRAEIMEKCILELTNGEFNNGTIKTLENLQKRREEIEKREEWLKVKETALTAINLDIEAKVENLQQLQIKLKTMLQEYEKRENSKIMRLVRVYETMKSKDAAKIFDELQGDILVDIAESMKEAKLAAIVADMIPEKAKNLSIALANKRQILTKDNVEK